MTRVLLTSFEPFGGHALNSSQEVGRALAGSPPPGVDLDWLVLPVVAGICLGRALERIQQTEPAVVLALGQAAEASAVRLEEVALNVSHFTLPDNAGKQPQHQPIVPGGPLAYRATARFDAVEADLRAAGVPVERSYHAGTYVCNHLYYGLLHAAALSGSPRPTGFVHLPLLPGQGKTKSPWTLDLLTRAVRRAVEVCAAP
jgi:pyroglutamyl-peptidase